MNYYISDYHFNHAKMLEYDERPFANVKEMEDALVENWNATVKPGDTVYILGDFYWKGKDEDWIRVLRRLTGNKVLSAATTTSVSASIRASCARNLTTSRSTRRSMRRIIVR